MRQLHLDLRLLCPPPCATPMHGHGYVYIPPPPQPPTLIRPRFRCPQCHHVHVVNPARRRNFSYRQGTYNTTVDKQGRVKVYLGVGHPYANTGGWQYLSRYKVMVALGRILLTVEHVDHEDRDKLNSALPNLRVMLAEHHGLYHRVAGSDAVVIAEWVDGEGFVEHSYSSDEDNVPF